MQISCCFALQVRAVRGRAGKPPHRLRRLRGLPCPVLPQESSHLPLQSTEFIKWESDTQSAIQLRQDNLVLDNQFFLILQLEKVCPH
jgi:hypothetical protein